MLCHRMGAQKPDGELIARFQKLCGNAFFHRKTADQSNVISTDTSKENTKNAPSERLTDRSRPLDGLYSFDGCAPSNPSMLSSMSWLPSQNQDFSLYSSGPGTATTFHDQSGLSPRSSFQEDPQTVLPGHSTHQPQSQRDTDGVGLMDPSQLWTSIPFTPSEEYPAGKFARRDSGYGAIDESTNLYLSEPLADLTSQDAIETISPGSLATGASTASSLAPEKCRFHTTLAAPTAMVNDSSEAPVSYLNKGQLYNIMVTDSTPPRTNTGLTHYRTSIRISFEQNEQRSDPAAYWQLWKNSRGWAESEKRDQKPLAVEYAGQDNAHTHIEQASLDGFRINWTVNPDADVNRCSVLVRFNFLSTDFTLSKGVKGASVRLCSKTEQLDPVDSARGPEICHCKVKLFRDHGAERKLSNDATIIRKRIEKLELQGAQPTLLGQLKKRKRGSIAADRFDTSPQSQFRDNQHERIDQLRHMLSSTRSESVLGLRGDTADDPDLYPTQSLDEEISGANDVVSHGRLSTRTSALLGSGSMGSNRSDPEFTVNDALLPPSSQSDSRDRPDMPVACFFTMLKGHGSPSDHHYRAIYPRERTVHELLQRIADKYSITAAPDCPVLYVNQAGLEILVDDEFVREMTEGQDMVVEMDRSPSLGTTTSLDTVQKIVLSY